MLVMVVVGTVPEMKIDREVMRLRICLRWKFMLSRLSWWLRTTLATEPNSVTREEIRVCVCVSDVGVSYLRSARLQLSGHLADLLEFIRGMSARHQCVPSPENTWPHLRQRTQAEFRGPPSMAGLTSAAARLSVSTEKVLSRFHRSVKRGLVIWLATSLGLTSHNCCHPPLGSANIHDTKNVFFKGTFPITTVEMLIREHS